MLLEPVVVLDRLEPAPMTLTATGRRPDGPGSSEVSSASPRRSSPRDSTATTDQVDPRTMRSLRQLGQTCLGNAITESTPRRGHLFVDRLANLPPPATGHVFRQAAHEVAAAHLGLELVERRVGRADATLDLLGRALADGDAVLRRTHVGLDRGVDVEGSHPNALQCDGTTEGDERGLGRAAADVDDHVANRLVDRQVGTDGRGHRLLDELGIGSTGAARRVGDRATLDLGDGGGTQMTARPVEAVDAGTLQQQTRIMRCVTSKSVIAPLRSGRTATM